MVNQTVAQLIAAAAEELEVIDSGGSLTTAETASCLDRLNRLIDRSNADRALIFTRQRDQLTLIQNQQAYTIGKDPAAGGTANFDTQRPVRIERANLFLSSTVRKPIEVISLQRWAQIRYQTNYGPPREVYLDNAFVTGFATLRFYQIPDQAYDFELYSWKQNAAVASTAATINYPPAYADYWLYGLVIRIASMFGRMPTQIHMDLFQSAKEAIGALNCESPELHPDPALVPGGGGLFNWLSREIED